MVSTRVLWRRKNILVAGGLLVVAAIFVLAACTGPAGPVGLTGPAGPTGPAGGAAPAAPPPKATALPADALKADYPDGVHLELKGLADEFRVKYSITIHNYTDKELANITINSPLPEASRFMEVTTTPEGAAVIGKPDKSVDWTLAKLAARSAIGPFEYKVSIPEREAGVVSATAKWESPTAGSVSASTLEFDKIAINLPKRGCPACHVLRDDKTGAVTIAYEAMHRGGPNHPKLDFDTVVTTCLGCHKPGTGDREGMGVVAPKMLRDIVHPVHMNSPSFTGTYKGNCFTCHNVDGKGNFTLLGEKLHTDFRGIPEETPVKGIPPSEGGK